VKPGPPSDEYLLRKLLRCERCGARMHGTRGSKTAVLRYMCSTRRYGHSCGERIVKAEALEGPPTKPANDRARALLTEFPRFWDLETEPAERRKLLLSLFEQIWAQNGRIVAVQPHDDFLPYFQAAQQSHEHHPDAGWCRRRERRGSVPDFAPRRYRGLASAARSVGARELTAWRFDRAGS
jgi:hypothetical protein